MDQTDDYGAPQLPTGAVEPGQVLSARYRVDELLGQRHDIAIWRGWDEMLSRAVLLYVLAPNHPLTESFLGAARNAAAATDSRFLRVLDVLEYGPSEPVSFIVVETVAGYHLQDLFTLGTLSGLSAAWIAAELADALVPLHTEGLTHDRLSPTSVIITTGGNVIISGFLIDTLIDPDPDLDSADLEQRRTADVTAIGRILYASLVGRWPLPIGADPIQSETYGLPVARRRGGRLVSPLEAHPGVSPILDAVCMQILEPRAESGPLRSAAEVAAALRQVLGDASATEDLQYRIQGLTMAPPPVDPSAETLLIRAPEPQIVSPLPAVLEVPAESELDARESELEPELDEEGGTSSDVFSLADEPTQAATPVGASGTLPDAAAAIDPPETDEATETPTGDGASPPTDGSGAPAGASVPFEWSLAGVLDWLKSNVVIAGGALLVVLVVLVLTLRSCGADEVTTTPGGDETEAVQIAGAHDFDPQADGGSGGEQGDLVAQAIDGNLETSWRSEVYLGDEVIPNRKPGVGLLLDLGEARDVASVQPTLTGQPATLQIMVPSSDPSSETAPTDSVTQWRAVYSGAVTQTNPVLNLDEVTQTRWVLLYFTELPVLADGSKQVGIVEVAVQARR